MSKVIDFYFEFYSPYAYLASHRIDDIAAKHGCEVNWRPFMLGATFSITGHGPLTETPLMGDYSLLDIQRNARLHNVPFQMPTEFPKVSLNCARAFYALVDNQPEQAKALTKGIYHEIFGLGNDGTQSEIISRLAKENDIDAEALLESIQTPEIKQRLKDETENAIKRGVFGAPFFFVDQQPFWGNDRLEQLDRWLETGGW